MSEKEEYPNPCCVCGKENQCPEPVYCCNGQMCGCMGMPINGPDVCSEECYDKLMEQIKNRNNRE